MDVGKIESGKTKIENKIQSFHATAQRRNVMIKLYVASLRRCVS